MRITVLMASLFWIIAPVGAVWAEVRNPLGVAVIIGNRVYQHGLPEVSFADRDAAAFKRYVIDVLGFDVDNVIDVPNASKADLERTFGSERSHEGWLWRYLDPDGNSDVVVFYSGHGVPGLNDRRGYLLPSDAHPDTAELNGYPIDLLYRNLGKLQEARTVAVYLDACFTGDSHAVSVPPALPTTAGVKMTVLTAARADQVAAWDETAQHGLFTHHLLDALYGAGDADEDGRVTAGEVEAYLKSHMTRVARRLFGRHQNATRIGLPGTVLSAVEGAFPKRPVLSAEDAPRPGNRMEETIQRDMYLIAISDAHEARDHLRVLQLVDELRELVDELPPLARYFQGRAFAKLRRYQEAVEALTWYAAQIDREGERYEEVLRLLAEQQRIMGEEPAVYEKALATNTAAAYRNYLERYLHGRYVEAARRLLDAAVAQEERTRQRQMDDTAFARAQAAGTAAACRQYLTAYPTGRHMAEARRLRDAAVARDRRQADDAAFARAQAGGTAAAYREYLAAYPSGRHVAEARRLRETAVAREQRRQPGQVFRDCPECPELVVVPAGSYWMGSPASEEARNSGEGPRHRVTIPKPFAVGSYEVTFAEWDACVRGGGCGRYRPEDEGWGRGTRPVINLSWQDARSYVAWLARRTGKEYRLPSESEWEYAARAGTTTPFHFGSTISTTQANYDGDYTYGTGRKGTYRGRTVTVGSFAANAFGLHDVHGNVWEWTRDCWNGSYEGAPGSGSAWERGECSRRVVRGGSWFY